MKNLILLILLVLQSLSVYVLYRNFISYKEQLIVYDSINNGKWEVDYDFYSNMETTLPNLSTSSLPLKAVKGYYYFFNHLADSLALSTKMLHDGIKDNPYIMYSEGNLATIYSGIKWKDSADIYARKAFKGLPKNAIHFAMIAKMHANNGQYDSIIEAFEKIKEPPQLKIYSTFLASMTNFMTKVDTSAVKKHARFAKSRFPYEDDDLLLLVDYVLFGKDKVKRAMELSDEAEFVLSQNKYEEGIELLEKALLIRKDNLGYLQTIGLVYYNMKNYKKVIEILENVRQKALKGMGIDIDPMSVYFLGMSYYYDKKYSKACEMFEISSKGEFEIAKNAFSKLCSKS